VLTLPLPATSLALSPDGRRLMTACAAGVGVWFADGKPADKKAVPRRRVQWLVDRAGECEKGKQWDALNFYCNRLIEVDPDLEGSTRHLRAWASFEQDKYEPVVTDVTRYLELKPPTEGVLNLRGRAYYGLDKYALAEADHTRALELDPKSFDGYYYRGLARAGQRKWADAIADYTQALAIDDTGSGPWRLRGVARAELGRWDQAVADFSEALERYPRGRLILSNLTIARLGQGDLPGYRRACLSMYERLTYPDDPETRNSVCWTCCVAPNEVDLARLVTLMDRAVAAEPRTYELLNTRGAVLYRAGRFKDAVKQLREAIEVHGKGGTFEDWVFLAMSHFRLGELETARSDFSRAIEFFDKRLAADSKERPAGWSMRVEWRFLRKEAEELIKPATP
jgi:tetratricopeptide (TPR) repeat protein